MSKQTIKGKNNYLLWGYPIITFTLLTLLITVVLNPIIVELISILFPYFNFSFPMGGLNNRSLIAQYGCTIAGIILVLKLYGIKGFKSTLTYSKPKPGDIKWLLVSLVIPITMILLSYLFAGFALNEFVAILVDQWRLYLLVIGGHIIASALAEEYGWRGFMLPQLLKDRSPFKSTFIIYIVVCLWHLPALLSGWKDESIVPFLIIVLPITIIHCWLFFKSKGSLIVPILFHAVFDAQYSFFSNYITNDQLANKPFHQGWSYIILYCIVGFSIVVATKGKLGFNPSIFSPYEYFGDKKGVRRQKIYDDKN